MSLNLNVRAIQPDDYSQWLPLWEGYNAFYGRVGNTALNPEITRTTWNRFFEKAEPVFALVAESEGKLVGLTHYIFHRSTTAILPVCYLQDLFTLAELRGQGVGAALIRAVYEKAAEAKSSRVYWLTHETNHTAMKLYDKIAEKSGFLVYRKFI